MQRERSAHEEFEEELSELTEDMAVCLGWDEVIEQTPSTREPS
jgi:hypothetical protein